MAPKRKSQKEEETNAPAETTIVETPTRRTRGKTTTPSAAPVAETATESVAYDKKTRGKRLAAKDVESVVKELDAELSDLDQDSSTKKKTPVKKSPAKKTKKTESESEESESEVEGTKKKKTPAKGKAKKTKKADESDGEEEPTDLGDVSQMVSPVSKKTSKSPKTAASAKKTAKEPVDYSGQVIDGICQQVKAPAYGPTSKGQIKILCWNVASLRSCMKKGFSEYISKEKADIVCLQETKLSADLEAEHQIDGYHAYFSHAAQAGYSGTAIFTVEKPLNVIEGIGAKKFDDEGRVMTMEFDKYYLVNAYIPNSGMKLERLAYKQEYNAAFLAFIQSLEKKGKPVIACGDLNVAATEKDVYEPETRVKIAGYTPQERADFQTLLSQGFVDTFRALHPEDANMYTFWSYRIHGRDTNRGWRLDYFICSKSILPAITSSFMRTEVLGSDHCPLGIEVDLAKL